MLRLPAREADAEKLLACCCCAGFCVGMRLEEVVVEEVEGKEGDVRRSEVVRDDGWYGCCCCCWKKRREENVRVVAGDADGEGSLLR